MSEKEPPLTVEQAMSLVAATEKLVAEESTYANNLSLQIAKRRLREAKQAWTPELSIVSLREAS